MLTFWIFFTQELLQIKKSAGRVLHNILFFLILCSVFFILTQDLESQDENPLFLTTIIIWFALLLSLLFSNFNFLNEDHRDGTLEQNIIFCENLEVFIAAKIIAAWCFFCLPLIITASASMFVAGFDFLQIKNFLILATFATMAINFICSFCASLNISENQASIISILALPLIIPILLVALLGDIKILAGLTVFIALISTVATTKIAKIISE